MKFQYLFSLPPILLFYIAPVSLQISLAFPDALFQFPDPIHDVSISSCPLRLLLVVTVSQIALFDDLGSLEEYRPGVHGMPLN